MAQLVAKSSAVSLYYRVALPCFRGLADQYEYFQNCTAPKAALFPIFPHVHCPNFRGQNWFTDRQGHTRQMHCRAGSAPSLFSQDALLGPKKAYGSNGLFPKVVCPPLFRWQCREAISPNCAARPQKAGSAVCPKSTSGLPGAVLNPASQ